MASRLTYPTGLDDHQGIIEYADRILATSKVYRRDIERTALRNILFYMGVQWIKWDDSVGTYRPLGLKKSTPKPITNRILPIVNTATSNLVASEVPLSFGPSSDDGGDVQAAVVADQIHDIIQRECKVKELKQLAAKWVFLTGNVFIIPSYDGSMESGTVFVQHEQCQGCGMVHTPQELQQTGGMCPECGSPEFSPAIDPLSQGPMGVNYPKGRMYTEVESVFTSYADWEAPTIADSPYFMTSRTKRFDWLERVYGEEAVKDITPDTSASPYTGYFETLPYSHQEMATFMGQRGQSDEPRVRVRRLWIRPDPVKAPKGIYAVIAGDKVLESMEWPFHNEKGEPFLNIVHIGFDLVPGRLLAKTRVDDLCPKQEQRNRYEARIEMHSDRMANAIWMVPEGVGLSKQTGEQGQIVRYNALNGVPAPQRVSGDAVSPYIVQMTQIIDAEMDAIFGQYEVGRGEAPRGVSAYAALQLLDERARQGQSSILTNWMNGWAEWARQSINIWREYADESRAISAGMGAWAIHKFSKADIQGGVDIQVDPGQNRPHTQIGRRAVIDQLTRLGFVNPFDPLEKFTIAEALGMPEILPDVKLDKNKASRENDLLKNGEQVAPPNPMDNHAIHWSIHRRLLLSEEFESLPPPIKMAAVQHIQLTMQLIQMASESNGGPGQVAPKPGVKGGENKGSAKGDQQGADEGWGGDEQSMLDQETQGASPDTNGGISM